jgi:hypothetical protein
MTEEEDDDTYFLVDDDKAEVVTYNHLVQAESPRTHRRSHAPPKVIRSRDLPSGHERIKADYFVPNLVYMISSSAKGKVGHISNMDHSMSLVSHIRSVLAGFGCVGIYSSTLKRLLNFIIKITTSKKQV